MKKITFLLLTILYCFVGYSQFPQNFEDPSVTVPNGFPAGWLVTDNGVGTTTSWTITNNTGAVINGTKSAFINRQEIGLGNTSEDWLISPSTLIPTNGQLRFFAKQTLGGDQGTLYQIRIYSGAVQNALTSYTILKQWTEPELNATFDVVEEKVVDFATTSFGTNTYIAFVRVFTQPTAAQGGDRWVLDDINVVQKCLNPTNLGVNAIAATQANLFWTGSAGATSYQLEVLPASQTSTGIPTDPNVTPNFLKTGLTQNTNYKYYVRSDCGNGNFSEWVGPFNFQTLAIGTACADPIVIPSLPYQTIDNTGNYGNTLLGPQTTACLPGGVNYQSGNDVFYSFTATENCPVSFTLSPTENRSSMFIYDGCTALAGNCLAAAGNTTNSPRVINFNVVAGTTYIIVISSNSQSPTVAYNLLIQCEACLSKPTNPTVSNITLTGADFAWTPPAAAVLGYQVAVQPQGSPVPSGAGEYSSTIPNLSPNNLTSGTLYQYWVRSECSPGVFSAWVGPIPFNTQICAPADQCTYIFRMTDSANNGWNGARMQVRQNGIVIATIGSTYNSGAGPVDVPVTVCNGVPFDIFWSVAGSQPQQCIVSVVNSFGQTLATVAGTTASVGTVIYSGLINCTTPVCTIPPNNLTVNAITTTSGTVNWAAPGLAGALFDIYIVPALDPAPLPGTTPTYSGVPGFSYLMPGLIPDTLYDVYVRVQCNAPSNSAWSVKTTFKTLPTCPKPINQTVTGITTTSAVLGWTEAASATQWEVLLLASGPQGQAPAAPGVNPTVVPGVDFLIPVTGATTNTPTTLAPATIYYYYVRAVCQPGDDKSTWTGPFIFNTITCNDADKCTYKFILTNTTNNNWNFGRMEVRQNGIVVATLGTGGINNPNGISVSLCNNVPFDLFWSVAGNLPAGIGLTIVNSYNDVVYTKVPGQGTPLTVLFSDFTLGNCTPPSCPKPINLLVDSVSQTSANLSWTETGTAIQWEVYVVLQGGIPPVNGLPLNTGVAGYYLANTNSNFPIPSNLLPGTQYQYYVRAICSTNDISTWTLLTPVSFVTKPINDECSASIPVPVNPTQVCSQTVSGNTFGGTASAEISTCPGSENDDVWFNFVATSNIHVVNLLNIAGSTTSVRFAVYAGGDCTTTTQIFCSATNNNTAVLTNLTVGTTYKIRVYTNGTNPNQSATFDVCVSTPPAPGTNDECVNAIPVTVNILSECAYVTPGNLIGATGSTGVSNACTGVEDDDVWFSFVAGSSNNIISLLNVEGTTTNLNHAVYSGTCGALVQLYCAPANALTSTNLTYIIGQTYYIRVWSNGSNSEVVTFNLCVKPISSCGNASPFCGGSPLSPYIFPNTSNIAGSSIGQVACLGSTPNPTYYTLHVGQTGPLNFTMVQNTQFNAAGAPTGTNLDVDFVAWGPFTSTDSCDQIVFGDCPTCPNNTTNPNFYPLGNIVDCSYSASFTETISIPNAQAGQFYIILITNFNGSPGFISLVQTNFSAPNAGATICCDVDLGPDLEVCANSTTLNALAGVVNLDNVPVVFEWYLNDVLIIGETQSTITVTQSGTYTVKGNCGLNPVEDSILVTMSPAINVVSPADYIICDTTPIDGFADFDLNTLTSQVLGTLNATDYSVTYYINETDAIADGTSVIDLLVPFTNTIAYNQTIYIRVESNLLASCYAIVPVNLKVEVLANVEFQYSSVAFCKDEIPNPQPIYSSGGVAGTFTSIPSTGIVIDEFTGEINLAASAVGSYDITNTILGSGLCGDAIYTVNVVIGEAPQFTLTGDTELCPDETTTITVVPTDNNFDVNTVTYEWTFNTAVIATATTSTLDIVGQSGIGTYTVTVNNSGCSITQTFEVIPSTIVWDITFEGTPTLCPNETGTLTATVNNNTDSLPVSYTFTLPDASVVVSADNVLPISQVGIYTVEVDILGCTTTQTFEVIPSTIVWDITFEGTPTLCPNETGTLTATVNNNTDSLPVSYTFTLPDASVVVSSNNVLPISQVGIYTVEVDILGCTTTQTFEVMPSTIVWDITFTGTSMLCPNETGTLTATVNNNTDNLPVSYTFTLPNASVVVSSNNVLPISQVGIYTVEVDILGCTTTQTFEVMPSTVVWDVTFGGTTQLCPSEPGTLTATVNNNADNLPVSYTFTLPNGSQVVSTNNVLAISQTGIYTVVADILGCTSAPVNFTVSPTSANWQVSFVGEPYQICAGESVELAFTASNFDINNPNAVYTWTSPSGTTGTGKTFTANQVGTYTLSVNIFGCISTFNVDVTVNDLAIEIDFTQGCQNNLYRLVAEPFNASFDVATSTFAWTGPNVIATDEPNVIVLGANGLYEVTVTNAQGCSASQSVTVNNTSCTIQRGISPNNDGENDFFDLSALNVKELFIYNRYGTEVYKFGSYTNQWKGQSTGGMELPDGTYFYIIQTQEGENISGWIFINR